MKTNFFIITNETHKDAFLLPIDRELQREFGILIKANHFIIKDFRNKGLDYALDFEEFYFQFSGYKRKIKPKNAHKHGILIQYG